MVFDEPSLNKSSSVAAGLFNPIIGKVMTRAWKSDLFFPGLLEFYPKAERFLGKRFFYEIPLYRPFSSVFEQNEWMSQSADPSFKSYIDAVFLTTTFGDEVNDPFGGLLLKQCGYLDVPQFMDAIRNLLKEKEAFQLRKFDAFRLETSTQGFKYEEMLAKKIVFCGGMMDKETDFFKWLPLRPLKGETLEVQFEKPLERIYNKGVYLAPAAFNSYRVGATYNPNDLTDAATVEGKQELSEKLDELLSIQYEIKSQNWGFRPCAHDRKLYLGRHPSIKDVFVFNGLGTKGVSLAPYFSNQLADFLEGTDDIDAEANIARIKRPAP